VSLAVIKGRFTADCSDYHKKTAEYFEKLGFSVAQTGNVEIAGALLDNVGTRIGWKKKNN
jgi:hypothetical protein